MTDEHESAPGGDAARDRSERLRGGTPRAARATRSADGGPAASVPGDGGRGDDADLQVGLVEAGVEVDLELRDAVWVHLELRRIDDAIADLAALPLSEPAAERMRAILNSPQLRTARQAARRLGAARVGDTGHLSLVRDNGTAPVPGPPSDTGSGSGPTAGPLPSASTPHDSPATDPAGAAPGQVGQVGQVGDAGRGPARQGRQSGESGESGERGERGEGQAQGNDPPPVWLGGHGPHASLASDGLGGLTGPTGPTGSSASPGLARRHDPEVVGAVR